ncbi:MAG: hypothetical protein IK130_02515 [Oscillospiraceae bacterium]|nr:hypothetical protein [Oscillospiraceae bacterium]
MGKESDSTLQMPRRLLDLGGDAERFVLSCVGLERRENGSGVSGSFEISYQCCGTESRFACDLTLGSLYVFTVSLDYTFDLGPGDTVVLKNDGVEDRSELIFRFDHRGHCVISGRFRNQDNGFRSGIFFSGMVIDNIYMNEIILSLEAFFSEIEKIQGHSNFW